jgi:hypothetical protein
MHIVSKEIFGCPSSCKAVLVLSQNADDQKLRVGYRAYQMSRGKVDQ